MKTKKNLNKRDFLKLGLGATVVAGGSTLMAQSVCKETEEATSGPFYPQRGEQYPLDQSEVSNFDLTDKNGGPKAEGQQIYFKVKIQDMDCNPLENALVQLWQADNNGHYNSRFDGTHEGGKKLDKNFQYWAQLRTNSDGECLFKTIVPKYYQIPSGEYRTAHFHIWASHSSSGQLVTQTYFEGEDLDDITRIRELNNTDMFLGDGSGTGTDPSKNDVLVVYAKDPAEGVSALAKGEVTLTLPRA